MPYGDGILESPADRYGKTTLCMRNAKRLFKCAAYVVYFVGVLVFAVASKGSFLLMTQSLGNRLQVCILIFYLYMYINKCLLLGKTICKSLVIYVSCYNLCSICISFS
jgi:hypothetical protein